MAAPLLFDHFEVKTDELGAPMRLGPGGMGTTYRAYDLRLKKQVALKLISEPSLKDPMSQLRFFNEARSAALLDHPNIARVLYLCPEEAPQCFYAMELIEGESLAGRVARHGPLSPNEALGLLRPVADALIALAEHHLVHRDIKPENIMIARAGNAAGRVKLIDFGLAKSLSASDGRLADVQTGDRFIGSVYFASPEQIRSREQLDARSDFYSLGATLWHILTGFPPFTGTVFEVQEAHVYREPPWEKIAEAPVPLSALLRRLLAKPREERPAHAHALLAAWDETIAGLETNRAAAALPLHNAAAATTETELATTRVEPVAAEKKPRPAPAAARPAMPEARDPAAALARRTGGQRLVLALCAAGVLVALFIFLRALFSPLPPAGRPVAPGTPLPISTPMPISTPLPLTATPVPVPAVLPEAVPPPPAEPTPEALALREKIARFLREFTDLSQDPDATPKYFAPSVEYYKEGKVDRAYIRRDAETYRQRWPQQTQLVEGDPKIEIAPDGATAALEYVIRFDVRNGQTSVRGRTEEHVELDLRGPSPLITSIKSNILERTSTPNSTPRPTPYRPKLPH